MSDGYLRNPRRPMASVETPVRLIRQALAIEREITEGLEKLLNKVEGL